MYALVEELFPICRSITGEGLRETLRIIGRHIPLEIHEVPSGTQVFDWTVPREWNIRDAYVRNAAGERIVDFRKSNLHVLGYSVPVHKRLTWKELKPHLITLPDKPDWVPYRTSYYKENWGFCISHRQWEALEALGENEEYEVCIDSTLEPGALSYGECVIRGETEEEVLVSCHCCHPSLANDNLSGIAVATYLARALVEHPTRYTYRFLFIPGTIGSITWLAMHEADAMRIRHGLVVSCVGDAGHPTYKKSRRGDAPIDRAVQHVLKHSGRPFAVEDFIPYGYDERQYCSPGFNLAVGCFMRTPNGRYPEYHTSADNLDLVRPESLEDSLSLLYAVSRVLEHDRTYQSLNPKCEPQLGKRGLYGSVGGAQGQGTVDQMALLWVLNLADGRHSLLDVAERSGLAFEKIKAAADALLGVDLLEETGS
jgi:aminopeptidase-like protein